MEIHGHLFIEFRSGVLAVYHFTRNGKEMESQMIAQALGKAKNETEPGKGGARDAGEKSAYPDLKRLRANEQDAARKNSPISKSSGKPL